MAKYTVHFGGASYEVQDDEYIMDAIENQGGHMAYSCRAGACTTCLCVATSGTVADDSSITTDKMKADGLCSPCSSYPKSDVTLMYIGDAVQELFEVYEPHELDTDMEAVWHYYFGGGASIPLSARIHMALEMSDRHQEALTNLMSGNTRKNGAYSVDLTDQVFFVGTTGIRYNTVCSNGVCTTMFEGFVRNVGGGGYAPDGFWDPLDADRILGTPVELPFSTPYSFQSHSWIEVYPDPGTWGN